MKMLRPRSLAWSLLLLILTTALPAAEPNSGKDWPFFRGNATQTGVAATTLPDKLDVVWTFGARDSIESTAAIKDGVVYFGSFDQFLYALELTTGKKKWEYKAGPFKAAAAVAADTVYIGDG